MNEENLFADERRREIITLLRMKKKLLVSDLCERYGVSQATIRTDLNLLEREGLLTRTHGGAIPVVSTAFELTSLQKESRFAEEKLRIARRAAEWVGEHDTVALDTGTTAYWLAERLAEKKNLTVVTPDLRIALLLEEAPGITVILAGGTLRKGFGCTVGSLTNSALAGLSVDKVFMATNAVTADGRLCTPDVEQAQVKKSLLAMGGRKFLLCDSSKFGAESFASFARIGDMDVTITDTGIPAELLAAYRRKKITVETV